MLPTLVVFHLAAYAAISSLHPYTVRELNARHLSTDGKDLPVAIDYAFAKSDASLFQAIGWSLIDSECADVVADQILRLYTELPDGKFKIIVGPAVARSTSSVNRVAHSRWACAFLEMAVPALLNPERDEGRFDAEICLRHLSDNCGLQAAPFYLKAILILPPSDMDIGGLLMDEYPAETLPPPVAYYIYWKFHDPNGFNFVHCLKPYEKRAESLIASKTAKPPSDAEIRKLIEDLDKEIHESEKKLCDQYGSISMEPLSPPTSPPQEPPAN
jgi:hypothetical protein